jgi:hypothetical protein
LETGCTRSVGYQFDPTDATVFAPFSADLRLLTWMRTRGGFCYQDGGAFWSSETILGNLGSVRIKFCNDVASVERIADLVYDERYWTHEKDDCKFPIDDFLRGALSPDRLSLLAWFLDRGQFRYTMGEFSEYYSVVETAKEYVHELLSTLPPSSMPDTHPLNPHRIGRLLQKFLAKHTLNQKPTSVVHRSRL